MTPSKATTVVALLLINQLAFADASYQSTTQITGGSLVETMQKVSFLSHSIKDMLAPITTTTMVHGNQKAVIGKDSTEITDLDGERIIHIDNVKKTYTIITFAEMRQAFLNMSRQMDKAQAQPDQPQPKQPSDIKTSFDIKVNNTGASKVVNGLEAQEQVITMTMKVTETNPPAHPADPNAPTSMDYTITTDAWVAPDPPEIKEIADFDLRFGQKLMEGVDMKEFAEQFKHMRAPATQPPLNSSAASPEPPTPWPRWPKRWPSSKAPASSRPPAWAASSPPAPLPPPTPPRPPAANP